jgi:hypothetical protein
MGMDSAYRRALEHNRRAKAEAIIVASVNCPTCGRFRGSNCVSHVNGRTRVCKPHSQRYRDYQLFIETGLRQSSLFER